MSARKPKDWHRCPERPAKQVDGNPAGQTFGVPPLRVETTHRRRDAVATSNRFSALLVGGGGFGKLCADEPGDLGDLRL